MTTDLSLYRPNVGVVLFARDGRVWYGRRAGVATSQRWQFPQGGVDEGEELADAARRELFEETGVRSVRVLDRTQDWLAYDFPPELLTRRSEKWKGQRQIWFAFAFEGDEAEIDLGEGVHAEFDAWRWGVLAEAPDLVVPFKRPTYEAVAQAFGRFAEGGF